jgi:hypothetical protein
MKWNYIDLSNDDQPAQDELEELAAMIALVKEESIAAHGRETYSDKTEQRHHDTYTRQTYRFGSKGSLRIRRTHG